MKTTARRVEKLEKIIGGGKGEIEEKLRIRLMIAEGRQRVADALAADGLPAPKIREWDSEDLTGLSVIDILNRGRARSAAMGRNEASSNQS